MISEEKALKLLNDAKERAVFNIRLFVVGGGYQYIKMFHDAGFSGARNIEECDAVCFTGGEDVDPELYGEEPIERTFYNRNRDNYEAGIYGEALALQKPLMGICRGAQFLNVMNGGKLWQDVKGHDTGRDHDVVDMTTGETLSNMTSTHHQMMIAGPDASVLAVADICTYKESMDKVVHLGLPNEDEDVEVVWYNGTQSLCFQPHPEFGPGDCQDYFLSLVDEYILPAC